ncbi:hypothetical protein MIR68_003035 [Amoeboaphelidium protococcarum]|nr:hypothetical protein MIR68_003035 [Amoeboaphelidium protococcarum]
MSGQPFNNISTAIKSVRKPREGSPTTNNFLSSSGSPSGGDKRLTMIDDAQYVIPQQQSNSQKEQSYMDDLSTGLDNQLANMRYQIAVDPNSSSVIDRESNIDGSSSELRNNINQNQQSSQSSAAAQSGIGDLISSLQKGLTSAPQPSPVSPSRSTADRRRSSFTPPSIGGGYLQQQSSDNTQTTMVQSKRSSFNSFAQSPFALSTAEAQQAQKMKRMSNPTPLSLQHQQIMQQNAMQHAISQISEKELESSSTQGKGSISSSMDNNYKESAGEPQGVVAIEPEQNQETLGLIKFVPEDWIQSIVIPNSMVNTADNAYADDKRYAKFRRAIISILEDEIDYPLKPPTRLAYMNQLVGEFLLPNKTIG